MEKEVNYNAPALAYTLVISALILILCYLTYISIPYTQTQIEQGGVEVNYGNTDQGKGDDTESLENPNTSPKTKIKTSTNPPVPNTPTEKTHSTSTEKEIVTQDNEDAEALKTSKKPEKSKKIREAAPSPVQPKPEKINQAALYQGPSSKGSGSGDGNTNQSGNQGSLTGSAFSHSYTGTGGSGGTGNSGNGSGRGVSLSLAGRKFLTKPSLQDESQVEGKISVTITADKDGNIVSAEAGGRGTTIQNEELWRKCESAVMRIKLNPSPTGEEAQTGKVVFSFKLL